MNYYCYHLPCTSATAEMLCAELQLLGFEAFEELDGGLNAFVAEEETPDEAAYAQVLNRYGISPGLVTRQLVVQRNWNAEWEAGFQPVSIGSEVYVRAPFHAEATGYRYSLCIQPKMSFGTGHHHTTRLMLGTMPLLDINNCTVLDYGCGTAILAILAEKLGAACILAIDTDEWAAQNVPENMALNHCHHIVFEQGDISRAVGKQFDVILANINKNILLGSMAHMAACTAPQGKVLMSGFYENDLPDIRQAASAAGLSFRLHHTENEWVAALFAKSH